MELTKKEIEKILGYEIANFKVTKKAYRGKYVRSMTLSIVPKKDLEHITVTISTNGKKLST